MEIFYISDISEIKEENKKRVAALGFFDGIHKAHQKNTQVARPGCFLYTRKYTRKVI